MEPRLAKALVWGAVLGAIGPALTYAACSSDRSPFLAGEGRGARESLCRVRGCGIVLGLRSRLGYRDGK